MKRVDPSIKLTAVGLETDPVWNYKVAERLTIQQVPYAPEAGEYIDYISAHYYPIGNDCAYANSDYRTRMTMGEFFHERTMLMRHAIENAADDSEIPVKVVWDEWNPMGERDGSEFTLEMALWSSTILNSFIRDSKYVEMANYTFFVGGNGPIQVTENGMLIQPEFYMMKLYAEHLGEKLVESWCDIENIPLDMPTDRRWPKYGTVKKKKRQIPLLDIAATSAADDSVTAFVTNISFDRELEAVLELNDCSRTYKRILISTLWHADLHADNSQNPDKVKTITQESSIENNSCRITFLPHSVNAITFLPD